MPKPRMPKSRIKISDDQSTSDCSKKNKKLCRKSIKIKKSIKRNEKSYTTEALEQAMTAAGGSMSLNQAAREFGIPKSTLSLKMRYFTPITCKKGPSTVLSTDEEVEIVNWIMFCAERGFPINKTHLLDCVQNYLTEKKKANPFKNNRPGKHWYNAFLKRQPELTKRIARNSTLTRAPVSEKNLRGWFNQVQATLLKNNLFSIGPERIFNSNESAFMLAPKDNTVLTKKGTKAVHQVVGASDKACVRTLITASASGEMAPPMVIFDCKTTPRKNVLNSIPKGWAVGHTESGQISSESFYDFIKNVFFKWLKEKNCTFPVLLYVDKHSSHWTLPVIKFCKDNDIELISLYPNATHIIQPLDVALFRPLEAAYAKEVRKYRIANNIVDFKKWMFAPVLKQALKAIDFKTIIKNGFHDAGLYPFNADAVNYNILNKTVKKKSIPESNDENSSTNENADSEKQQKQNLLKVFESDLISSDTLKLFKRIGVNGSWDGDIKLQGLFDSWKKLKQLCGGID
ncbi:uncharacterized protein LOC130675358 [Microplitis mediator]|uniref:uncharacterized protein LOC130675358 n=1 Tax=Microplitis mediator TaxID=375433 RepID=UPI002556D16E|nr:uncharacterized protein LOC130675358 [Microplitis mediator]